MQNCSACNEVTSCGGSGQAIEGLCPPAEKGGRSQGGRALGTAEGFLGPARLPGSVGCYQDRQSGRAEVCSPLRWWLSLPSWPGYERLVGCASPSVAASEPSKPGQGSAPTRAPPASWSDSPAVRDSRDPAGRKAGRGPVHSLEVPWSSGLPQPGRAGSFLPGAVHTAPPQRHVQSAHCISTTQCGLRVPPAHPKALLGTGSLLNSVLPRSDRTQLRNSRPRGQEGGKAGKLLSPLTATSRRHQPSSRVLTLG